MAHYEYKVLVKGGVEKNGKVTARDESTARVNVASKYSVVEWIALSPVSVHKTRPLELKPKKNVVVPDKTNLTKLQKLLFLQHGNCFFCGKPLELRDASIEHLNPISRGGSRTEDNEVVCHKSLNSAFGDLDLKRKFEYALRNAGHFTCP